MKAALAFFKVKKHWILIIAAIFLIWSQWVLLKPHLKYGFSDVDWGFLSIYKTQNNHSPSQFINNLREAGTRGGVYTHQIYYIGILGEFFELDYQSYQVVTHIFKILTVVFSFPIFLMVSGSLFIAALSTLIFSFSSLAFGTLYTTVTSSDYSAVFAMEVFLIIYGLMIKKNIARVGWLVISLLLLVLTLFLSTERMYPLPVTIILIEVFQFLVKKNISKKIAIKRLVVLLSPLFIAFLAKPSIFLNFFQGNGLTLIDRVVKGDWNLLLTPFIALGSSMLPIEYNKYFGVANTKNFLEFTAFFINGPLVVFFAVTLFLKVFLFKNSSFFLLRTLAITFVFNIFLYITASHFVKHEITGGSTVQASCGFYILALSITSFWAWLKSKDPKILGIFIGPWLALIYIILTWLGASPAEVFSDVHRYLTVPALLMALFLGSLIGGSIINIFKLPTYLSWVSLIPTAFLIFFMITNYQAINIFFENQLRNGFGAEDKNLMRSQLNSYIVNLKSDKPSLFYFDFSRDNIRGYYYDNALLAGFQSWMLWHKSINFDHTKTPMLFWNNLELLKTSVIEQDGKKVFFFGEKIYDLDHFYAFELIDKKVIDIKQDVLNKIDF